MQFLFTEYSFSNVTDIFFCVSVIYLNLNVLILNYGGRLTELTIHFGFYFFNYRMFAWIFLRRFIAILTKSISITIFISFVSNSLVPFDFHNLFYKILFSLSIWLGTFEMNFFACLFFRNHFLPIWDDFLLLHI